MDSLGETIRKRREDKELPLRIVAAYLDIDQAILSKIERGHRNASREQVVKLARFFKINETDLLVSWLSDKLVYEVANEDVALKALKVAEEKVKYQKMKKTTKYVKSNHKKQKNNLIKPFFVGIKANHIVESLTKKTTDSRKKTEKKNDKFTKKKEKRKISKK
jgi:transcriptional regulator with XRE-family HTH domain